MNDTERLAIQSACTELITRYTHCADGFAAHRDET